MRRTEVVWPKQKATPSARSALIGLVVLAVVGVGLLAAGVVRYLDTRSFSGATIALPAVGLLLLGFAFLSFRSLPVARELDRDGVVTQGRIVGKRSEMDSDGDRDWYVAYEFGDGHGAVQRIGRTAYGSLDIGSEVSVRYLERDPNVSRLEM